MRHREKLAMVARVKIGKALCDCGAIATRIDPSGRPECQPCHNFVRSLHKTGPRPRYEKP